jgi:hypothetical protein
MANDHLRPMLQSRARITSKVGRAIKELAFDCAAPSADRDVLCEEVDFPDPRRGGPPFVFEQICEITPLGPGAKSRVRPEDSCRWQLDRPPLKSSYALIGDLCSDGWRRDGLVPLRMAVV